METDHPLTLTVEQAGQILGVGRSTAYELVRTGDLASIRLRRRIVVPAARVAECLAVSLADVWNALEAPSPAEAGPSPEPAPARGKVASRESGQASLF